MKRDLTKWQYLNVLRAKGRNPIHLFGNVYLVRKDPSNISRLPLYIIKIIREYPLDKQK